MDDFPLPALLALLFVLMASSAFCSGAGTALMTINRYRLKIRAQKGERGAQLAQSLLRRPDRLIGTLLLGKTLFNSLAVAAAVLIALRLFPDSMGLSVVMATAVLTLLLLSAAEIMPKTLAALHPERFGIAAARILWPITHVLWPLAWVATRMANGLLRLFGVSSDEATQHSVSTEELRTVVAEAGAMIPHRHQKMLGSILDLEKATVEDIMVPRNEIFGIDISEPSQAIRETISASQHTRIPVFEGSIDNLKGVVHLRRVVRLAAEDALDVQSLLALAREPYFIPEGTPLNQQLLNFQNQKRRIGFVVDEYGDIQGLVTIEDILEEVIGEFTSDPATRIKNVYADADGSYRVTGSVTIRSLNRTLGWKLPAQGPKTVNGLLLEKLENLPQAGAKLEIAGYEFEITEMRANAVKATRILPPQTSRAAARKAA